jgi:hypothetical protein
MVQDTAVRQDKYLTVIRAGYRPLFDRNGDCGFCSAVDVGISVDGAVDIARDLD